MYTPRAPVARPAVTPLLSVRTKRMCTALLATGPLTPVRAHTTPLTRHTRVLKFAVHANRRTVARLTVLTKPLMLADLCTATLFAVSPVTPVTAYLAATTVSTIRPRLPVFAHRTPTLHLGRRRGTSTHQGTSSDQGHTAIDLTKNYTYPRTHVQTQGCTRTYEAWVHAAPNARK